MKNTLIDRDYNELTKEQQDFVRELAEDAAGHSLNQEGIKFWMELQRERK